MSSKSSVRTVVLITLLAVLCSAVKFPLNGKLDLTTRDTIVQGWALVEDGPCPEGNGRCGEAACCPDGSYCDFDSFNSNICCPTDSSDEPCGYNITLDSRCAVDSWLLFTTSKDPICCMPGQIGINPDPDEDYGHCNATGHPVAATASATLIGSAGVTAPYGTYDTAYTNTASTPSPFVTTATASGPYTTTMNQATTTDSSNTPTSTDSSITVTGIATGLTTHLRKLVLLWSLCVLFILSVTPSTF